MRANSWLLWVIMITWLLTDPYIILLTNTWEIGVMVVTIVLHAIGNSSILLSPTMKEGHTIEEILACGYWYIPYIPMFVIRAFDWNKIIEDHFQSILKRNSDYKYTREEHKQFFMNIIEKKGSNHKLIEDFILGSTEANNKGYFYHPV